MAAVDAPMDTGLEAAVFGDAADDLPAEFATMTADEIGRRARLLANEVRVLKDEATRLGLEQANLNEKVRVWCERVASVVACVGVERRVGRRARAAREARRGDARAFFFFFVARGRGALRPTLPAFDPKSTHRSKKTRKRSSSTTSCRTWWATSSR